MARKTGQIIRRGTATWLVRIYVGHTPETRKRRYIGKFIHGGLRSAQAHLNRMLAERDLGRNIRSSRQTVGQYLDHWLTSVPDRGCGLRASATIRAYSHGTSIQNWEKDRSESFRRQKFRRSTASCSAGNSRHAQFVTRTQFSSQPCGRRFVGNFSL